MRFGAGISGSIIALGVRQVACVPRAAPFIVGRVVSLQGSMISIESQQSHRITTR